MYKGKKIIVMTTAFNEEVKIGPTVQRIPREIVDEIVCIDDGSTDLTAQVARESGAKVISIPQTSGVGNAIRIGLNFALERRFDIIVFIAGNNKDDPSEIPRLLDPICDDGYHFVQGSRFLSGGHYGGDMPSYRKFATRLHPVLLSLFVRKQLTESTNGFRAIVAEVFLDPQINLKQSWLDKYEMEVYLLYKTITLGYKHTEVPCTKIYPSRGVGNTKMKPVIGWWSILRPILLLGLHLRK